MTIKGDDATAPPSEVEEDDVGLADMKNVLMDTQIRDFKTGKKKSYWSVAMETMGMAGGKDGAGDLWLETVEQGVPMLRKYIKEKNAKLAEEQASAKKKLPFDSWMDLVPLEEFRTTETNFVKSFLKWAIKDREDVKEGTEEAKLVVNASKARRRMDSYFDWMKDNMAEDLAANPLTLESIMPAAKVWDLNHTHLKDDQFGWWFDIATMDQKALKAMDDQENLRYVVWYSHLVMFDTKAQDNGVLMIQGMNKVGFWATMTLIPMELSAKMDRLTIGVLPIKMKGIYIFGAARWLHLMMNLMKPFLSKKMRERMIIVTEKMAPDTQLYCDEEFGRAYVPDGFLGVQGDLPHNDGIEKFKKRCKKKEKKAAQKAKEKENAE